MAGKRGNNETVTNKTIQWTCLLNNSAQ